MLTIDPSSYNTFANRAMLGTRQQQTPDQQFTRVLSDALTSLHNSISEVTTFTSNVKSMIGAARKTSAAAHRENRLETKIPHLSSFARSGALDPSSTVNLITRLVSDIEKLTRGMQTLDLSSSDQPIIVNRGSRTAGRGITQQAKPSGRGRAVAGRALAVTGIVGAAMAASRSLNTSSVDAGIQPQESASGGFADWLGQTISSIAQGIGDFFGGSGGPIAIGQSNMATAQEAVSFFISKGWSREQAAGIVGNLMQESQLNPGAIARNDAGPGQHSYGIAQWNKGRFEGLRAFAAQRGKDWKDLNIQLEYVNHELNNQESKAGKALRSARTVEEAATIVDHQYERSTREHTGKRIQYARQILTGDLGGNASQQSAAAFVPGGKTNRQGGEGRLTSGFGMRWNKMHRGIDIGVAQGTPVYALRAGTVVLARHDHAGPGKGYGFYVDIDHGGGTLTRYAHLSAFSVKKGDRVDIGQQIGAVGSTGRSTGPHLHFEVHNNGRAVDPQQIYKANKWIVGGKELTPPPAAPSGQQPQQQAAPSANRGQGKRRRGLGGPPPQPPKRQGRSSSGEIAAVLTP